MDEMDYEEIRADSEELTANGQSRTVHFKRHALDRYKRTVDEREKQMRFTVRCAAYGTRAHR